MSVDLHQGGRSVPLGCWQGLQIWLESREEKVLLAYSGER